MWPLLSPQIQVMGAVWQKPESIACENDPQYSSENGQIKMHFSQDPGNLQCQKFLPLVKMNYQEIPEGLVKFIFWLHWKQIPQIAPSLLCFDLYILYSSEEWRKKQWQGECVLKIHVEPVPPTPSLRWEKHRKSVGEGPRLTSKEGRKAFFVQKERKRSDLATLFYVQTRASLADCISNGQDRRGAGWWRASPLHVCSTWEDQVTRERWCCQEEWMQEITSGVGRGKGITGTENDPLGLGVVDSFYLSSHTESIPFVKIEV